MDTTIDLNPNFYYSESNFQTQKGTEDYALNLEHGV